MKYCKFLTSIVLSLILFTETLFPVLATNTVDELEKETQNLDSELSDLNDELSSLSDEIDEIVQKISATASDLAETQEKLAIAKVKEETQYEAMSARVKYLYENGDQSLLETLLESHSIAEFLAKAQYIAAVSKYDQQVFKDLQNIRETIAKEEENLKTQKSQLDSYQSQLEQTEAQLYKDISATETELSAYTQKLEAAKQEVKNAEEEARKKAEEAEKKAEEEAQKEEEKEEAESSDSDSSSDISVSASDLEIFAALIECEAGTTHYEGMLAVASVVVNRMKNRYYPDTIRGVIYQAGQFSPVSSGRLDKVLARGVNSSCLQVAQEALAGKNNVGDCLSFRAAWTGHDGIVIGGNVFF